MDYNTNNIRNAVLLGHAGSGKTSLVETMLFESGATTRIGSIEEGNTISDFHEMEREKKHSIFSSLMHVLWGNVKINFVDTPGFDDFIGEAISGLKVADTAVVVINAKEGIEVQNELHKDYIEEFKTPTLFVINQMDHEKADFEKSLQEIKNTFGNKVVEIQFPYQLENGFNHIVDALRMVMYTFDSNGGKPKKEAIPEEALERAKQIHNQLVEIAAEEEEGLMERYFEQGTLSEEELTKGLQLAMGKQNFFPVFCASAKENKGTGRIMGFIRDICPSPLQQPDKELQNGKTLAPNASLPTSIFIYKTLNESQIGELSYFKVYSGKLKSGETLKNQMNGEDERINKIFIVNGKNREPVEQLVAGDLGVTIKLKNSHTNNTLNAEGHEDVQIRKIKFPQMKIRMAVVPPSKSDFEKLTNALHIIQEEDPTFTLQYSPELKQTIIHGQGQMHFDVVKQRIKSLYNIDMELIRPKIPYRETISKTAEAQYRHKKQSGGAGQFAEVHLRVEPYDENSPLPTDLNIRKEELIELPWGGYLHFLWCIVGGSIDTRFIGAIKKGIMAKMEEGPLTGSYCQNVRVSVFDGKMHPVDSNDIAFQLAASAGFSEAFKNASPKIMEPIYELEVLCDAVAMGDVMTDLQSRRAVITGIDNIRQYQQIKALIPIAEMYGYSTSLRSITQGKSKFSRQLWGYQVMNHEVQEKLLKG
ncbi:elongation factor G [Capnocytophaga canimorsus]|uniref:elongation factor G n=1 Tax=Capnocytophaga canimorsus TaxID=28188 RepID=UPI001AD5DA9D|nr:elongation factor G [Capnocytophaga canimorsus]GIM57018.1 elongation factor G [Capnocytophaga canimorsus]